MQPRVARFCETVRRRTVAGARVLDYGCGTGHVARALADLGFQVTGADVSPEMLSAARRDAAHSPVRWIALNPNENLPFADGSFEAIVSSSVLEYVSDLERTLSEFRRILSSGGWLLATVPDPAHRSRRLEELLRRALQVPGAGQLLQRTRFGPYVRYLGLSVNRFPLRTWQQLMEKSGFSVHAAEGGSALAMVEAALPRSSASSAVAQ